MGEVESNKKKRQDEDASFWTNVRATSTAIAMDDVDPYG